MTAARPIAFVVLAGGKSRRMGSDKRALRLGKETLLDRAVALARAARDLSARDGPIVVSGDARAEGVMVIADRRANLGPVEAIASVAAALAQDVGAVVFFPVDMPLLEAKDLAALVCPIETPTAHAPKGVLALSYVGFELPMAIVLNATTRELIEGVAHGPRRSIRALLCALSVQEVDPPPAVRMQNTNTVQEWEQMMNTLPKGGPSGIKQ